MTNSTPIYAMPNMTEANDLYGMFTYVNTLADGLFMPVMLLVVYAISFISSLFIVPPSVALIFSSFIATTLSMILAVLGLLSPQYMYLTILLLAVGIFWNILSNR